MANNLNNGSGSSLFKQCWMVLIQTDMAVIRARVFHLRARVFHLCDKLQFLHYVEGPFTLAIFAVILGSPFFF